MLVRPIVRLAFVLLTVAPAARADGLNWLRKPEAAVAAAKRQDRPLMFYLIDRSRSAGGEQRKRHTAVFRDRQVCAAGRRFVCIELAIDQHPDLQKKWGLVERVDRYVVFTTPDGELLHQTRVIEADDLARKMNAAFGAYVDRVWQTELLPTLNNEDATTSELIAVVRRVESLAIREADRELTELLEREQVSNELRGAVFAALGELSTSRAVEALIEYATTDARAAAALSKCNPIGAERMLQWLGKDDAELHLIVYHAVTRICAIEDVLGDRFWEQADERSAYEECRRVRELVREAVAVYRKSHRDELSD